MKNLAKSVSSPLLLATLIVPLFYPLWRGYTSDGRLSYFFYGSIGNDPVLLYSLAGIFAYSYLLYALCKDALLPLYEYFVAKGAVTKVTEIRINARDIRIGSFFPWSRETMVRIDNERGGFWYIGRFPAAIQDKDKVKIRFLRRSGLVLDIEK